MEISSRTIKPVDDVRLATGEISSWTRSIVTFSTVKMVTVVINGGLVESTSYHQRREGESKLERRNIFADVESRWEIRGY